MSHRLLPDINVTTCNSTIQKSQQLLNTRLGQRVKKGILRVFSYWKPKRLQFVTPKKEGVGQIRDELQRSSQDTIFIVTDAKSMDYVNLALANSSKISPKIIGQYKGSVAAVSKSQLKRIVSTYAEADLLLGLTEEDAQLLSEVSTAPVSYVPNPIPSAPKIYLDVERKHNFVALGRLAPEKNYHDAIRAWKLIADRRPGWSLHIYGDGPLRQELGQYIRRHSLTDSVRLMGRTNDPLLVLSEARANLVTSDHEGFGLTISEASSVGTPTIAYDSSPGIRLQVESGKNGFLVPKGDTRQLADSIERVISDAELYEELRVGARKHMQKFDVETTVRIWESLFADL